MKFNRGFWLVFACSLAACDGAALEADTAVEFRDEVDNGMALNSAMLNGMRMNGMRMNGTLLNGMRMNGWTLNGFNLNSLSLEGSAFSATQIGNGAPKQVKDKALKGSLINLDVQGETWLLRLDNIYKDPADPKGDVWFYDISVQEPGSSSWDSLCYDHLGQPTQAIPLANYWDPVTGARIVDANVVTFACRDAVLAKCVEWGYRPWAIVGSTSLANHHQACTRMARADYCGDGTPHTFTGTPIDVFDVLKPGVQKAATLTRSDWGTEAEWGPNGAVCVGDRMRLKMFDDAGVPYVFPSCLDALDDVSHCGNLASARQGLVANRYCDKWQDDPQACDSKDKNHDDEEDESDD